MDPFSPYLYFTKVIKMPRGKPHRLVVKTEAELQAEFYHQCRLVGIVCRLELWTRAGIPDCIIATPDNSAALLIVEVKRGAHP